LVLVKTLASVASAGAELYTIKLGGNSLIKTALDRSNLVGRVANKFSRDGLAATLRAARNRKQQRTARGYRNCGKVVESARRAGRVLGEETAALRLSLLKTWKHYCPVKVE